MVKKSVKKSAVRSRAVVTTTEVKNPEVKKISAYYTPVLMVLLLIASFYIGRLSAQVDSLKNGSPAQIAPDAGGTGTGQGRKLDVASLKARAKSLGLNSSDFDQCLDSGKMAQRVANEQKEGSTLGVTGTPSFFINGIMIVGAQPQSSFETVIDAELKDGSGDKAAATLGEAGKRVALNLADSYTRGASNAKIKIVEFTDFECPFCERAYPTIAALEEKYKGKISLIYKSFPLSFHPNAQKAAEAALCAGEQGKFWEMHDNLFISAE